MSKIPKLRFKKFSKEWDKKKLGELLEFKNGINGSKEQYGKGIKFINVLDVLNNDYITYDNIIGKIDIDEQTLKKNIVEYGDVLFQRSSETREEVGTANVYLDKGKKATFGGFIIRGKKIGDYNPAFINKLLKTKMARKEIISRAGGSTRYNVGQEILKDVELLFPSDEEQQKIARFFYLIDKKIEKQQEKVEVLKDYKKGMMQKIFSQEIRFKGDNGEEYPEWEEKKAEKLFESISDKKHNGELEVLSATQDRGVIPRSELNIDIKYEESSLSSYKRVRKNNFIISLRSFQGGIETSKYDGLVSPAYTVFNFKENEKQNHDFFSLIFKSRNFINRLNTLIYGIRDGKAISFKDFAGVKLQYPCIEEQEKIALFFLVIHKKLEKEQEKLDSLNEWKKGLLQQMFV
ncbi:restriction endonuclease subunit S [Clostridium botulinum]|uniref:Restriction endonuclease subunit S n=1 Tax=Clostridium botulinum TaxID=1491 RepID=A0ABC8CYR6_CLOBO|nr:restriction endonuclease subunit S [Clostridium botulinum]AVQ40534.1 restriction endonuclease subunit S [Clostridium botulinum]